MARVIVDRDQVYLTADGVKKLVKILKSEDESAVILAGKIARHVQTFNYSVQMFDHSSLQITTISSVSPVSNNIYFSLQQV